MKKLKSECVIVLILVLAITGFNGVNASLDVFKKSNFTSLGATFSRHYSFENGRLLYALCDKNPHEYKCQVIQERSPFENPTYSCNVTLKLEEGVGALSSVIVIAFGEDKALLTWEDTGDKTFDKFITVHLPKCQLSKQFELRDMASEGGGDSNNLEWVRHHQIATYKDTYDVFFRTGYRNYSICSEKKLCRLTVDSQGTVIQEPMPYMDKNPFEITSIYSVKERSPTEGHVFMKYLDDLTIFMMIQSDGSEKQLMKFERNDIDHSISTANYMIGICARAVFGSDTQCGQFNLNGKLKLATNLTNENVRLQPIRMYNLPEGGFLLLFVEYKECTYYSCWTAPSGYSIMKVNASGKKVGDLRLKGFEDAANHEATHIWQKENGDGYCVFFPSNNDLIVNCFTGDDFE